MKYDYIYDIEKDGYRIFEINDKYGLLYNNKEIIPAKYDFIWSLEDDGYRIFELTGEEGLLYKDKEIVPAIYDWIYNLEKDGCRIFRLNGKEERKNIKEIIRKEKLRMILEEK